jgi:hypothetical protein
MSNLTTCLGHAHSIYRSRCDPHQFGIRPTFRLHPIRSGQRDREQDRSPGLLGSPCIHDVFARLQTFWSGLLRSYCRSSTQTDMGNPHHRRSHDSTLASPDGSDYLPLPSCDCILAICFRGQRRKVPVSAMGHRLRYQQCHLSSMRFGAVYDSCGHHQGTQGQQKRQAQIGVYHDARIAGDCDLLFTNVSCYCGPMAGAFVRLIFDVLTKTDIVNLYRPINLGATTAYSPSKSPRSARLLSLYQYQHSSRSSGNSSLSSTARLSRTLTREQQLETTLGGRACFGWPISAISAPISRTSRARSE